MTDALNLLIQPLGQTLLMILVSTLIATIFGGALGILLFALSNDRFAGKHKGARFAKHVADRAINVLRSFPYIILMVLVLPLSRLIVGTSLGTRAAIVPLSIAAIPFLAALWNPRSPKSMRGVIDAAISCAASKRRIVFAILIPEALPSLVSGLTLTMISLLGYSAMAGVIGGGGLEIWRSGMAISGFAVMSGGGGDHDHHFSGTHSVCGHRPRKSDSGHAVSRALGRRAAPEATRLS
jgi:D-methionine transport system permease protein